ncbi:MAG: bifunctional 5-dehydro-2-deoxygluconokinase/5-dehydro-2-deoxyphosphogluconate aldolase [Beijerinckiaceae bacterium]
MASARPPLDVITIGRSSVDLYGSQVGGRLEDMASFSKAVGGCPTNIAIGGARLGLKTAVITRVGDEAMGRFIVEQLQREGVNTDGIKTDQQRLTALVILGIRDDKTFPLIFYRENCADAALDESDIAEDFIKSARAIVVSGTHFSKPNTDAAQRKAIAFAKKHGRKVAFDIDYRPNLWGVAGHDAGEERYVRAEGVTAHLQTIVGDCDLIVGTEEEFHIAGGSQNSIEALRAVRKLSAATLVCKRGPMGCSVFTGPIPDSLDEGIRGPGFPVEVYNVLGAGDAFMAGFLRGWLRDEPMETCCTYANASGAFAVSRLLCSAEYPTWDELQFFLKSGSSHFALRHDKALNDLHWATTRRPQPAALKILSIDHRMPLIALAQKHNVPLERIAHFKNLVVDAAATVSRGRDGYGMFLDGGQGREALFTAHGKNLWLARPVDKPHARPLDFEAASLGAALREWPMAHTVKCALYAHPDEPEEFWERIDRELIRLHEACRVHGLELLLETLASPHGPVEEDTVARVLRRVYDRGVRPDWWVIEDQPSPQAWKNCGDILRAHDPRCRGLITIARSIDGFGDVAQRARSEPLMRGFCAGRSVWGDVVEPWMTGSVNDAAAVQVIAGHFAAVSAAWDQA